MADMRWVVLAVGWGIGLAGHTPASAQDDVQLETITVVGSRISYRDLLDTPAVSLTRRGDSLQQQFMLRNDTRNEDLRRDELHQTIRAMMKRAGKRYAVVHPENYVGVLDEANYRVEVKDDGKLADAGLVNLALSVTLEGYTGSGEELIRDLRKFIEESSGVGRTEIVLGQDTALSLTRPERYRYELLAAIATDSAKVRAELGQGCKVSLDGLNSRVEWERISAVQLVLYIPYSMSVTDCGSSQ